MKRPLWVVFGIVVVLAFGLCRTYRLGDPAPAPSVGTRAFTPIPAAPAELSAGSAGSKQRGETHQRDLVTLREQVALLREQVSALQQQIHEQERVVTGTASERAAGSVTDPSTNPAAQAQAGRERQEQMAVLEANFRQEPTDREWASGATGAVQRALASDDTIQRALRSLECRAQTCRVEMAEDDTGVLGKGLPLFLLQLGQTLPSGTAIPIDDGAGGTTVILYLSRETNALLQNGD
jgi:hypothetical protein